jgi:hypothetical protein
MDYYDGILNCSGHKYGTYEIFDSLILLEITI